MSPSLVSSWVLLFVLDVSSGIAKSLLITFFHRNTPDHMLGRALGTIQAATMLASPVGMLPSGALIASQGFGMATLIGAVAMVTVSLLPAFNSAQTELPRPAPTAPLPQGRGFAS